VWLPPDVMGGIWGCHTIYPAPLPGHSTVKGGSGWLFHARSHSSLYRVRNVSECPSCDDSKTIFILRTAHVEAVQSPANFRRVGNVALPTLLRTAIVGEVVKRLALRRKEASTDIK
jgi:hypothetical protein